MHCVPDGHGLSTADNAAAAPGAAGRFRSHPDPSQGRVQPLPTAHSHGTELGWVRCARQGSAGAVLARSPARGSAAPAPCRAAARPATEMGPPLHAAALPGCTRATRGHHSLQEAEQRSRESSQGKGPGKVQRGASLAVFAVNAAHPVPQHRTAGVRCALRPPLCHTTAEHHSPPPSRFCGTGKGLSLTEYNAL